jgi:predicted protein tyrosine phosphatase
VARLYVCGREAMPGHVRRLRPSCVVSLLPAEDQPPTPGSILGINHLRLHFDDIETPEKGAPQRAHIEALIGFLRARPRASVLLHCMAGISRSTAAALVAMTIDAPGRELEAGRLLRTRGPHAYPNRLILEHADAILGRGGRLVALRDELSWTEFVSAPTLITLPRWTGVEDRPTSKSPARRARRPPAA